MPSIQDLTSQSLFSGLDNAELDKLLPMVSMVRLIKDEYVFREKSICKGIYLVKSGRIEISKTTADGWKQPLVIVGQGNFIGEIATLEKSDHATDARAIESAELFLLPKEALQELETREPHSMLKIMKNIAIVSALNVRRMNEKFLKALVNY